MSVGILILAAGGSKRLGQPKQLLKVNGQSLLRRSTLAALGSSCRPIVAVLGSKMERCSAELVNLPVEIVCNEHWTEGISTSIHEGIIYIQRIDPTPDAVVIVLCDQPFLTADLIDSLAEKYHSDGFNIVASEYDGIAGVPALFAAEYFELLKGLRGDQGARKFLQTLVRQTALVPFPDGSVDIDTARDYDQLLKESR